MFLFDIIGWAILGSVVGIFLLLILIVLLRAACFKDKTNYKLQKEVDFEKDDVVGKLGEMLKYKTITYEDQDMIDFKVFQAYIDRVKELYPLVFSKCEFTQTKEYAIKLKLKGKSDEKPTVLMAHYDVVPVTEGWDHDPFLGEVVDGYLYGRGSIDTKLTMACALSALEVALKDNYIPENDLYLCFGANEEIYGDSQVKIVEQFKLEGVKPFLVFDEGGGIINNAFPGVTKPAAMVGVVEKGMVNIKLSIETNGGHSSTPKRNGPIIRMSKALCRLEKNHMKADLTRTNSELLNIMGRNSSFAFKLIFANMWLFKGLVKKLFPILGADTNALLTSTFAFTIMNGGNQSNVIPNHVEANLNVRVASFNTPEEVIAHVKKVIKDKDIVVTAHDINKMYPECDFNHPGYGIIKETTIETYNDTIVTPFTMLGGTDARHYNEISDCVIRFTPVPLTNEDRKGVHGLNEKIKVESIEKCLEFYKRLLTKI